MTLKPLQIGITGGIGSGKSLICKIFQQLNVPVYDADTRARVVMTNDHVLIEQIKGFFGQSSYLEDGSLNRAYISEVVFQQPEKLKKLNDLVHPRVAIDYTEWVNQHEGKQYVVKEAALLYESGSYRGLNKTIVVYCPEALRIKRVLQRDTHRSVEQINDIIKKQMPEEDKLRLADFVITNDETQLVIPQVLNLHQLFMNINRE